VSRYSGPIANASPGECGGLSHTRSATLAAVSEIHTRAGLAEALRGLGVRPGDVLLVHTSVKALGWIPGGPLAVVQALRDAVGDAGTIVVPTQTATNSEPSVWAHPPVPEAWWPVIRESTPGFDPALTPSDHMGRVPEVVRTWPGARRSAHPQTSFAALGPLAEEVVAVHDLDSQCGERSPLAVLERLGARILLLGATFGSCTAFHLAEYRVPGAAGLKSDGAAVLTPDGGRAWLTYEDLDLDEDDFDRIGEHLRSTGSVSSGRVGEAECHLVDLATAVDTARDWMMEHRERTADAP
jgi:aminoglycoside 3-N-acetyltransferase